jgi:hypothetical protein
MDFAAIKLGYGAKERRNIWNMSSRKLGINGVRGGVDLAFGRFLGVTDGELDWCFLTVWANGVSA